MQLKWMEDFAALAEVGSFSRAAELRHVTHPAFGRRIRALEAWAGTPLVERGGVPVVLTAAGSSLLDNARQLLADVEHARSELLHAAGRRQNRVTLATGTHARSHAGRRPAAAPETGAGRQRDADPDPLAHRNLAAARTRRGGVHADLPPSGAGGAPERAPVCAPDRRQGPAGAGFAGERPGPAAACPARQGAARLPRLRRRARARPAGAGPPRQQPACAAAAPGDRVRLGRRGLRIRPQGPGRGLAAVVDGRAVVQGRSAGGAGRCAPGDRLRGAGLPRQAPAVGAGRNASGRCSRPAEPCPIGTAWCRSGTGRCGCMPRMVGIPSADRP